MCAFPKSDQALIDWLKKVADGLGPKSTKSWSEDAVQTVRGLKAVKGERRENLSEQNNKILDGIHLLGQPLCLFGWLG